MEREAKQAILREEILFQGHDPIEFVEFLKLKKEGGDDIENWSLEEVRKLVSEFQNKDNPS